VERTTAVEARHELARRIRPSAFPADRRRLVAAARVAGAPPGVEAVLEGLPDGVEYATLAEVWAALAGPDDGAR
jgi:hypothetical protein